MHHTTKMKNNAVVFCFLEDGENIPIGLKWIPLLMIFDVKCDFTTQGKICSRWTLDWHTNTGDIFIGSHQGKCKNWIYSLLLHWMNLNFWQQTLEVLICRHLLWKAWIWAPSNRSNGNNFMSNVEWNITWQRPSCKGNGSECYEYIFVYVDDLLAL